MDYRDKFISVDSVLIGLKTFKECYKENEEAFSPGLVEFACNTLDMVEDFVKKSSDVDIVKVIHGRWLPYGFGKEIMCSVCRCELGDVWEYRYCPNCGAHMDGGKDGKL